MRTAVFWSCMAVACSWSALAGAASWPTVSPLRRTFHVQDVDKADVVLDITSPKGKALYELQCHSAGYRSDPDFDYSGDFECRLSTTDELDDYSTLLTEDPNQSRDWESRGRFLAAQLIQPCGNYPNLGRTRTFRLRGFDLTLSLSHIKFDPHRLSPWGNAPRIDSLDLQVSVVPDADANSNIAASPSLPPLQSVPKVCRQPFRSLYIRRMVGGDSH